MDKKDVEIIAQLLPIAINLATRLVQLAKEAKAGGIDIPSLDELKALNDELKGLADLDQ